MLTLPDLPYAYDALAPTVSAETMHVHHDKHHKAYVDKANAMAEKAGLANLPLEALIKEAKKRGDAALFNNAAQAWNHGFFWESMAPKPKASGANLKAAIDDAFGDLAGLKKKFVAEGVGHFGSGWAWLVTGPKGLEVISTHDADDTFTHEGLTPLLVCDLWEHAYYLDYKNDRAGFLTKWLDTVANWEFASKQFDGARNKAEGYRYPMAA